MRSSVKVLSVAAALAMAVGLSACDEDEVSQPSPGASSTASAKADSDDSDASPSEDSKDDKDGKDAKDTKSKSGETTKTDTVYLLHCTLDFNGDVGYSSTLSNSTSLQDKTSSKPKTVPYGAKVADDLRADGLDVIDTEDAGSGHVEGWFAFVAVTESTKLKPFSEGTTSIAYNREEAEHRETGKQYAAYSDTQDLVLK